MVPNKFTRPRSRADVMADHLRRASRTLRVGMFSAAVGVTTQTLFRALRGHYRRRMARGEKLRLDTLRGPAVEQSFESLPHQPADLRPRAGKSHRARHMQVPYPPTDYSFVYGEPPISGNVINGRGETTPRRANYVFFGDGYRRAWGKLDWFFQVMEPSRIHRMITRLFWQDRRRVGPVASRVTAPADPVEAAGWVERVARRAGASLVGITHLTESMRYHDFDLPFVHAVAIAIPMDRKDMVHTPSDRSRFEIQRVYHDANRIAIEVAEAIRAAGWPARASTNLSPDATEVLHIPVAIAAGLGQLGKHGSLITREHGSNVRLAVVLTDLPLAVSEARDIGVDDFCTTCRICEQNCPPHAISPTKQMVRGVQKWTVDFDACIPYFAATFGCGICIHACPWSEPGRGFVLSERLLTRRERRSA